MKEDTSSPKFFPKFMLFHFITFILLFIKGTHTVFIGHFCVCSLPSDMMANISKSKEKYSGSTGDRDQD